MFTRNNLAFGDASFYFGNAKHPVAVPGSIIRPDAAEGKCSSAYYEVLGLVSRRSPARQQSMSGGEGGIQLTPRPIKDLHRFSKDFPTGTSHFLIERAKTLYHCSVAFL